MMEVSCVTAVLNAVKSGNAKQLLRCIESVSLVEIEHEHIIVDGGSTDGTLELLRKAALNIPDIKIISELDKGIYDALNKGVRAARGEWLYVLGSDDAILYPDRFLSSIKEGNNLGAEMVVSPVVTRRDEVRTIKPDRLRLFAASPFPHQGVLMRLTLIRRLNGFDMRFRIEADYDLEIRAVLSNAKIIFCNEPYAEYGTNGISSVTSSNLMMKDECDAILSMNLHMTPEEVQNLIRRHIAPMRVVFRLLVGPSRDARCCALYLFMRFMLSALLLTRSNGSLRWH